MTDIIEGRPFEPAGPDPRDLIARAEASLQFSSDVDTFRAHTARLRKALLAALADNERLLEIARDLADHIEEKEALRIAARAARIEEGSR